MRCPCCGHAVDGEQILISLDRNTLVFREHEIRLAPKQAEIAHELVRAMPGVISADRLIARVWGGLPPEDSKALCVHLSNLRKRLPPELAIIHVPGRGYFLHVAQQTGGHNGRAASAAGNDRRVPR